MLAAALFAAQAGANVISDHGAVDVWSGESAGSTQITVFNPNGTSYSILTLGMDDIRLEPVLTAAVDESLPDQITVFEPDGLVYSYQFTPLTPWDVDVVYVGDDDVFIAPLALTDDTASAPAYVAYFVSPPTYTGLLEDIS
jgi:hypothetical protein